MQYNKKTGEKKGNLEEGGGRGHRYHTTKKIQETTCRISEGDMGCEKILENLTGPQKRGSKRGKGSKQSIGGNTGWSKDTIIRIVRRGGG